MTTAQLNKTELSFSGELSKPATFRHFFWVLKQINFLPFSRCSNERKKFAFSSTLTHKTRYNNIKAGRVQTLEKKGHGQYLKKASCHH